MLFHDTQHLLEIVLQIMFYATPIIYKPQMLINKDLGWAVHYNPFAVSWIYFARPLLDGTAPAPKQYRTARADRRGHGLPGGAAAAVV